MTHALHPFAESLRHLKTTVTVERKPHGLDFSFVLMGARPVDLGEVVLRPLLDPRSRSRRDEIWKGTCLELFVGPSDGRNYVELNLCPSGDWNAYAFDNYRQGMRQLEDVEPPLVSHSTSPIGDHHIWTARLSSNQTGGELERILASPSLVLSATAVIEYQDGVREYWALTHSGEKPDFHIRESFRLAL